MGTYGNSPKTPPRPCRKAGCPLLAYTRNGYCEAHQQYANEQALQREAQRVERDRRRGTAAARGYGAHWQHVRADQLRRYPLCAMCGRAATVVHHLDHNQRNNAPDNLQSLCRECHEWTHGRRSQNHEQEKRQHGARRFAG